MDVSLLPPLAWQMLMRACAICAKRLLGCTLQRTLNLDLVNKPGSRFVIDVSRLLMKNVLHEINGFCLLSSCIWLSCGLGLKLVKQYAGVLPAWLALRRKTQ